jgi:hypothetical protein
MVYVREVGWAKCKDGSWFAEEGQEDGEGRADTFEGKRLEGGRRRSLGGGQFSDGCPCEWMPGLRRGQGGCV